MLLTMLRLLRETALTSLVDLVVKGSPSKAEHTGIESRLRRDFSGSSHASDFKDLHSSGYPARRLELYSDSSGTG